MSVDNAERHHRQYAATILLFPILSVVIIWPVVRWVGVLVASSLLVCGRLVVTILVRGKNERFSEEMAAITKSKRFSNSTTQHAHKNTFSNCESCFQMKHYIRSENNTYKVGQQRRTSMNDVYLLRGFTDRKLWLLLLPVTAAMYIR